MCDDGIEDIDVTHGRLSGITLTKALPIASRMRSGGTAIFSFNGFTLAISKEGDKNLGLYTVDTITGCRGTVLGTYSGLEHLSCRTSDHIVEGYKYYIDGSPCIHPRFINGIPVGMDGASVFAYMNEPSRYEQANVVFMPRRNGTVDVVVAVDHVEKWSPLLVCYGTHKESKHHSHSVSKCAQLKENLFKRKRR